MSAISRLRIQSFRTHGDRTFEFSPGATIIIGPNGSGKTSIIEAVHVALRGSSFKGSDGEIVRREDDWYRIDVSFNEADTRTVKFDPQRATGKKQYVIDGKTHYRLPAQHKLPIVLFEPEDLRLLNGSPTRRRQFIDQFISQLDPKYALSLRRYDRALKQRNTLLKQPGVTSDALFVWNVSLSEHGAYIMSRRQHYIKRLNDELGAVYRQIAKSDDVVAMAYSFEVGDRAQQQLLDALHMSTARDTMLGFTSVGPHRHDVLFSFNTSPALSVASRGEVRTIILALKFLEVAVIEQLLSKKPVILLDDVFSELDADRQATVVQQFTSHQTIVASVNAVDTNGHVIDLSKA